MPTLTKVVIDSSKPPDDPGHVLEVPLSPAELTQQAAEAASWAARDQASAADTADLASRRATILSELQAIGSAATFAAAKGPLLRLLVFLLKRQGEQAA